MTPTPTPADPGVIDQIRRAHASARPKTDNPAWKNCHYDCGVLLAAVEALRERIAIDGLPCACRFRGVEGAIRHGSETGVLVDPDDPIRECALHTALRERVAELKKDLAEEESDAEHYLRLAIVDPGAIDQISWKDRAEAEAARVVELAGALSELLRWHRNDGDDTDEPPGEFLGKACATLSATPAEAIERARAAEVVIVKARRLMNASSSGPFRGDARRDLGTALKALAQAQHAQGINISA